MAESPSAKVIFLPGSFWCPETNASWFPSIMFRNKEKRNRTSIWEQLCLRSPLSLGREGNRACVNLPAPLPSPGSQDSEGVEEQKREKILELKKKEKLLQEKLLKKVEELKKICLREAVSGLGLSEYLCWVAIACVHYELFTVLFYRSSRAECQRSIHWTSARRPLRSGGEWAPRSSYMTTYCLLRR